MKNVALCASDPAMNTMGTRLREARSKKFKSAADAARALGINVSTYRAHENGQNEYSPAEAEEYARKFGTTAFYLLTGKGPWHIDQHASIPIVGSFDPDDDKSPAYTRETWRPSMEGAIPELHGKLGAGEGVEGDFISLPIGDEVYSGHRVVAEWMLPEQFLGYEAKVSRRNAVVMEVVGDSMMPTYFPGDRVILDLSQNTCAIDAVYAISDGSSEPQIKRLQRVPFSEPVQVRIISDNASFQIDTVPLDRVTIIGRVCGRISRQ